ncbi:MAG: hypothetical protein ACXVDE_04055, partial [Tumebacillaceae bacterium]
VGNENTFADFLMNTFGVSMIRDLKLLHAWKYVPVRCDFNPQTNVLRFRRWNDVMFYEEELVYPRKGMFITKEEKKNLVKRLISSDKTIRDQAETDFHNLYV